MPAIHRTRGRGFTLVELLTVIAIIGLLISLLVPAVHKVREVAKKTATRNLQAVLAKGCDTFHAELGRYPRSQGNNPFQSGNWALSGAQWLILELCGADLQGFVMRTKDEYYDVNNDGQINQVDWKAWYALSTQYHRFGPYVTVDPKAIQTPDYYIQNSGVVGELPDSLKAGSQGAGEWPNNRLAFPVDAFGYPVLYYVANAQSQLPFTDWSSSAAKRGRYDQGDNWQFTGSKNSMITDPGFDLGGGEVAPAQYHWLYELGWSVSAANARPEDKTFAGFVYDRALFGQAGGTTGKVWPRNADTYLFISPGKDGIYGTGDDVTNF